jgi:hypothetical protein
MPARSLAASIARRAALTSIVSRIHHTRLKMGKFINSRFGHCGFSAMDWFFSSSRERALSLSYP